MSVKIKINEAQPTPCSNCGGYYGYQYHDTYRMSYTSVHDENGAYEGGQYNDGVNLNRGKTAYCSNCGKKLPFKLIREFGESIE